DRQAAFVHFDPALRGLHELGVYVHAHISRALGRAFGQGRLDAVVADDEDAARDAYLGRGERDAVWLRIECDCHGADDVREFLCAEKPLSDGLCYLAEDEVAILNDCGHRWTIPKGRTPVLGDRRRYVRGCWWSRTSCRRRAESCTCDAS